ncbi:hypothetical protein IM043_gp024 [Bacillus phage SPG24]|nr:hypothetical protein IM043_gp024 [Bacillus phage SPG24]
MRSQSFHYCIATVGDYQLIEKVTYISVEYV